MLAYRGSAEQVTFTVKDKEVMHSKESSYYLIYTEDQGVLQVDDSMSFLRFDSSDMYSYLERGKTYDGIIAGWRVPLFSWYPNVIEATEVR